MSITLEGQHFNTQDSILTEEKLTRVINQMWKGIKSNGFVRLDISINKNLLPITYRIETLCFSREDGGNIHKNMKGDKWN